MSTLVISVIFYFRYLYLARIKLKKKFYFKFKNPVYCLKNCANEKSNLISMSNDGKICFWLIENMNKPVDMQELISSESSSSASISPMCIDLKEISSDSVSKGPKTKLAVIGAEDGSCSSFVVKKK